VTGGAPVPDEEVPEALQLHAALSIACLGLRLILGNAAENDQEVARQTLAAIRSTTPAAREYIPEEEVR
jgi:hypothetical protein